MVSIVTPLSIDPEKTRVVLVGASKFPADPEHLPELPSVVANVEDLKSVLADIRVSGIPPENIIVLLDELAPANIVPTVVLNEAKKAEDTFIFYYSGHGLVGRTNRELYLATGETVHENADFGTAIEFDMIRRAIGQSSARKRILILDCCYSGRALEGAMGSESDVQQSYLDLEGTYSIASAPATKAAIAPEGEKHTAFTGELLRVLNNGLASGKPAISLQEIYDHIRNEFRRRAGLPEPQQYLRQDAGSFVIAYNRQYDIKDLNSDEQTEVNLPSELQQAVVSPLSGLRRGSAYELDRLLRESNLGLALTAHQALEQLKGDDDSQVSAAAEEVLARDQAYAATASDIQYDIALTFKEAIVGIEKEIEVTRQESCQVCHGAGVYPTFVRWKEDRRWPFPGLQWPYNKNQVPPRAGASVSKPCKDCDGSGRVVRRSQITIKIPAGVDNGMQLRLTGEGDLRKRNLYLRMIVDDHPFFTRQGDDLHLSLPVSVDFANAGGKVRVPRLEMGDKKAFDLLTLPPKTKNGKQFPNEGAGVPLMSSTGHGNLLVTIQTYSRSDLTDEMRKLIEHIKDALNGQDIQLES